MITDFPILSIVSPMLGLLLVIVSFVINDNIIERKCNNKNTSLSNSTKIVSIIFFGLSIVYMIGQRYSIPISYSIFLIFNLVFGIIVIVLFSLLSKEIDKCKVVLSGMNTYLVNIGITVGSLLIAFPLLIFSKQLYDDKKSSFKFKVNDLEAPLPADYKLGLNLAKNHEGPKRID